MYVVKDLKYPQTYPFVNEFGYETTQESLRKLLKVATAYCKKFFKHKPSKFYGLEIATAILKVIHNFDVSMGVKESTYLYYMLRFAILHEYYRSHQKHNQVIYVSPTHPVLTEQEFPMTVNTYLTTEVRDDVQPLSHELLDLSKSVADIPVLRPLEEFYAMLDQKLTKYEANMVKCFLQGYTAKEAAKLSGYSSATSTTSAIKKAIRLWRLQ